MQSWICYNEIINYATNLVNRFPVVLKQRDCDLVERFSQRKV